MTDLIVQGISVQRGETLLVDKASFDLRPGKLTVLLGPNGAGKTSLLRAILGLEKATGSAQIAGHDLWKMSAAERARHIAYLPQTRPLAWPNTVRDVVALGRFSHGVSPGTLKGLDAEAVDRVLQACELEHLAQRRTNTLSGGELARMHCARAFAAEAPLLIADEPIAALDPRHQFRILHLIKNYVDKGGGALVVLHDIQLAVNYASRLIWMKDGQIVADGSPAKTLSTERLADVYGISARVDGLQVMMSAPL